MKKVYSKPLISVEEMSLNQSIATAVNCTADKDIMEILIYFGYFMPDSTCSVVGEGDKVDSNFDGVVDEHDTICYHSNIQTAFLS